MDRYIGKLLDDRYEIQEVIGSGGMAVVYKALCHRLNRPVAIKILKDDLSRDEEFRRRFHGESQAVAMMSHPNIVSVYDVSHTEGVDYIVMELIDGISLRQYMQQKGALNWRETLHFATQICKALEHAHGRGIIHRDIKPHNIMILKDGSVKVADFGIAHVGTAQTTLTGEALGSVHYISPEQAKGGKMDFRADLYSLGVVMYEMLTGRPPFDGDTPVSVAIQHFNAKATPPRALNPTIPEGLEQITLRAMEADISLRYPSASQMLQDMESFRQNPQMVFGESVAVTPETADPVKVRKATAPKKQKTKPAAKSKRKKKSRWPSVLIGSVIILAAIGFFAFMLTMLMRETFRQQEDIIVPDLKSMTVEHVQARYGDVFDFEIIEQSPLGSEAKGVILNQKPQKDMTVKTGATIKLYVSTGSVNLTMPPLENVPLEDARAILAKHNVTVREVMENNDKYVTNYIIRTEPVAGTPLTQGQEVVLVVSTGSEVWHVKTPKLTGMSITDALSLMEENGFEQGEVKYVVNDAARDTVVKQSVTANDLVRPGTQIDLEVSLGPAPKAQTPVIDRVSQSMTVQQFADAYLSIQASAPDGGTISYEWFVSETDSPADLKPVGTGAELEIDTANAGTLNYCCKVTNTLNDSAVSIYSDMIAVVVEPNAEMLTISLNIPLPEDSGDYVEVIVKLDSQEYMPPTLMERYGEVVIVNVTASGVHHVEVIVDGKLMFFEQMNFDV